MKIRILPQQLKQLLSIRFLLISCLVFCLYLSITIFLPNYRLLTSLIANSMTFIEKTHLIFLLFLGGFSAPTPLENSYTIITGMLVSVNLALFLTSLRFFRPSGQVAMGSQSLFGIAISGCSSCGTSLLSVFAGSLGISILPFQIHLLQFMTIFLLLFSFFYTLQKTGACQIKR